MRNARGQFLAGQSGNPGGRPRDNLTALLREAGELPVSEADPRTRAQALADRLWRQALSKQGHVALKAAEMILDRMEGKPRQTLGIGYDNSDLDRRWLELLEKEAAEGSTDESQS